MQVYVLKYMFISQKSYLALTLIREQLYLVSAIDAQDDTLTYIYMYSPGFNVSFSAAYILFAVFNLYYYSVTKILRLDVLAINIKGVSLYIWLNYQVIIQRKVYSDTCSKYSLTLVHANLLSRNLRKRYLIFRYCKD